MLFKIWLIISIVLTSVGIAIMIYRCFIDRLDKEDEIRKAIGTIASLLIVGYCLLVVHSYRLHLEEKNTDKERAAS